MQQQRSMGSTAGQLQGFADEHYGIPARLQAEGVTISPTRLRRHNLFSSLLTPASTANSFSGEPAAARLRA